MPLQKRSLHYSPVAAVGVVAVVAVTVDVVAVTGQMKVDPAVAVQTPVVAVVQVAVAKGT